MGDSPISKLKISIQLYPVNTVLPQISFPPTLLVKFQTMRVDSLIHIAKFLFLISSIALVIFIMLKVTA